VRLLDERERRGKTRFPIELVARYAVQGPQEIEGTGRTVNISSNGLLMTSAHEVSPSTSISVVVQWPIAIGNVPLALHIRGSVVRCDHGFVAVRIGTHELRPGPKPPESAASGGSENWRAQSPVSFQSRARGSNPG
jgi:hypothetical protein